MVTTGRITYPTTRVRRTLDLCYYLGDDVLKSHLAYNPNWGDSTPEGVRRYINEMTFEANKMIGLENLRLVWKGNTNIIFN